MNLYYFFPHMDVTDFCTSFDVIGWLNGRASVFGTEGYGFESRVGLQHFLLRFVPANWCNGRFVSVYTVFLMFF
jgi:hypothetical protein